MSIAASTFWACRSRTICNLSCCIWLPRLPFVPVELVQSTEFAAKMKEVGAACELIVVPGGKHGMGDARKPEMLERMIGFFDGHLKPGGE